MQVNVVKLSRKMKAENGVLPEVPALSKEKVISEELKTTVKTFYESDEISRQCPGKKIMFPLELMRETKFKFKSV